MIEFLRKFIGRSGHLVFSSSIVSKIVGLLSGIIVVRLLSQDTFGDITYARALFFAATPFVAAGLNNSLLRYGAIMPLKADKNRLFNYSLKNGVALVIPVILIIVVLAPILTIRKPGATVFLMILALSMMGNTVYQVFQSYLRIMNMNSAYSKMNNQSSIILLLCTITLTIIFGGLGFVSALVISPIISMVIANLKRLRRPNWFNDKALLPSNLTSREYLRYGILVSFGGIASQLTLMTDNIVIGNLIEDSATLAIYRVGSILPFNLMFIPVVFMLTDFVTLAENALDRKFIIDYLKNYWKLFCLLSLTLLLPLYLFAHEVITFLFGAEYGPSALVLRILIIGLVGAFMLRIPIGNILNAVGKAKWTLYNSYFVLIVNLVLSCILTFKIGIKGAAIGTCIALWLSGFISLLQIIYYLSNLEVGGATNQNADITR